MEHANATTRTPGASTDEITLTIPRDEAFRRVANLVVGGVAARLNFTFETLDDLEVALETLLERAREDGPLTVRVRIAGKTVTTAVGPFTDDRLPRELTTDAGDGVGLRRILETVVDGVALEQRDDGHWVELTKHVRRVDGAA